MNHAADAVAEVVAVLDNVVVAAVVLEWSLALARVMRRDLSVVYVESRPALLAAALPITQVLAHAGGQWASFDPQDVERGYRVHAARLRALTERAALQQHVRWSMRVTRGALNQEALGTESDLVLIGTSTVSATDADHKPGRPRRVLALVDESPISQQVQRLAADLAVQLGAARAWLPIDAAHAGAVLADAQADLLVLPRALAIPGVLALARRPVLLVG